MLSKDAHVLDVCFGKHDYIFSKRRRHTEADSIFFKKSFLHQLVPCDTQKTALAAYTQTLSKESFCALRCRSRTPYFITRLTGGHGQVINISWAAENLENNAGQSAPQSLPFGSSLWHQHAAFQPGCGRELVSRLERDTRARQGQRKRTCEEFRPESL